MNFNDEFLVRIRNEIIRYLDECTSESYPITATNLWEVFYNQFKELFDSNNLTKEIFCRNLIFLTDKGEIRKTNTMADPTVHPDLATYYL